MHRSKTKRGIHSLPLIIRQMSNHILRSKVSVYIAVAWEDKQCNHRCHLFLPTSLSFYWWAWRHIPSVGPFVNWGQLSWPSLPSFLPSSSLLAFGGSGKMLKRKLQSVQVLLSSSQNTGVLSALFQPKCKTQYMIGAAVKNVNSIPARAHMNFLASLVLHIASQSEIWNWAHFCGRLWLKLSFEVTQDNLHFRPVSLVVTFQLCSKIG